MPEFEKGGMDRRQFLRRAAVTTAAAAWAAPIVQTVAATPAYASHNGTPHAGMCTHSPDPEFPDAENCMDTCGAKCGSGAGEFCDGLGSGDVPNGLCQDCDINPGNQCPSVLYCDPDCIECPTVDHAGAIFIC
jgi:hypothetical protein